MSIRPSLSSRSLSPRPAHSQRGWSLVELAVGLSIGAIVLVVLASLLPVARHVSEGDRAARDLALAEEALVGYALAHDRLPAAVAGKLPIDALGLARGSAIGYQPLPALTAPSASFEPSLPPGATAVPRSNGLDFCAALAEAQRAGTPLSELGMSAAFALSHPVGRGHERRDTTELHLPGSASAVAGGAYAALGIGELAARMACPDRVARVRGAERAAWAAYDAARMADMNLEFREFDLKAAQLTLDNAEVARLFGILDVAFGAADEALAALQMAAGWPPDGIAIPVGIAEHVVATVALGSAIANLVLAEQDVTSAEEGLEAAGQHRTDAQTHRDRMRRLADASAARVLALDAAGLTK